MSERSKVLHFRAFRRNDAALLGAWLEATGLQVPPGMEEHTWANRLLDDPHIHCWAAVQGGACVGFLRLDVGPDRRAEITLLVRPELRGQGFGDALLDEGLREARRAGLRELLAVVQVDNERALTFFRKHGFDGNRKPLDGFWRLGRFIHRAGQQPPLEIQG